MTGTCASSSRGKGSIPGQGTKILCAMRHSQKFKEFRKHLDTSHDSQIHAPSLLVIAGSTNPPPLSLLGKRDRNLGNRRHLSFRTSDWSYSIKIVKLHSKEWLEAWLKSCPHFPILILFSYVQHWAHAEIRTALSQLSLETDLIIISEIFLEAGIWSAVGCIGFPWSSWQNNSGSINEVELF